MKAARKYNVRGLKDYKGILAKEASGALICPRLPHSNWRVFSQEDIDEIIKAFSPGGVGYWHFNEHRND